MFVKGVSVEGVSFRSSIQNQIIRNTAADGHNVGVKKLCDSHECIPLKYNGCEKMIDHWWKRNW